MSSLLAILLIATGCALLGFVIYWLFITTEGVFLGRRMVIWLYDRTATDYDSIKQFDPAFEWDFLARPLLRRLASRPAPVILDVATGTGRLPALLLGAPTFHGRVVGLDGSRGMLALAYGKLSAYGARCLLCHGDALALPYASASFDVVTCIEALEFFPADLPALAEMQRVLKPGGILLTTRRAGWEARAFLHRTHSRQELTAQLNSLGFTHVQIMPWQVDYEQVFAQRPH